MQRVFRQGLVWTLIGVSVALTSGCQQPDNRMAGTVEKSSARTFGAAERKAARALSIANRSAIESETDPARQARLCIISLGVMERILRDSGAAKTEMISAIAQARKFYGDRRGAIKAVSPEDGGSAGEMTRAEHGRVALACLQRLQLEAVGGKGI